VRLLDKFDAEYVLINNDGPVFWFRTDLNAPRSRVVAIDIRKPEQADWKELIPQARETLKWSAWSTTCSWRAISRTLTRR